MDSIEQEIQQRASVAPRVTPADIEAAIASEHYFTGKEGVLGGLAADGVPPTIYEKANAAPAPLGLLTICVLVLANGFTVVGTSACASPANFDAEIGRKVARADAVRQVWPLLGYALREKLAGGDAQVDALVERFLTWPVPADVWPDGTPGQPGRTGTNLLTATQARAMLQHVLQPA